MSAAVLQVEALTVEYRLAGSLLRRGPRLRAVDGVTLGVAGGDTLGVVGESGCGKSTLVRSMIRLVRPTHGRVCFEGRDLAGLSARALRRLRGGIGMVFQDPLASLDPRMTAAQAISEPLRTHRPDIARSQRVRAIHEALERVGLSRLHAVAYPHELSGGQCQRVAIARALVLQPRLLICDEAVSALDVSIQAQIVNLLKDLQAELDLAVVFVAHDLAVVRHMSHRVAVMYLGRVVETAAAQDLFDRPLHPYTRALLAAVPRWPGGGGTPAVKGEPPSPLTPPAGCRFHPRCPLADSRCQREDPALRVIHDGHLSACHYAERQL